MPWHGHARSPSASKTRGEGPITDLLNIESEREGDAITLKQTSYITKLCKEYTTKLSA